MFVFVGDNYIGKKFTGDDMSIKTVFQTRSVHTYSTTALRKHIYQMELNKINKLQNENNYTCIDGKCYIK